MKTIENQAEFTPQPKNITDEFLQMDVFDFEDFVETLGNQPLIIQIDWLGIDKARKLKAYASQYLNLKATIRATEKQHEEGWNVFNSGVHWEKI